MPSYSKSHEENGLTACFLSLGKVLRKVTESQKAFLWHNISLEFDDLYGFLPGGMCNMQAKNWLVKALTALCCPLSTTM